MSTNTSSDPTYGFTIITDCYVYLATWLMATDAIMLTFQLLAHRADVDRHQCTCARERLLSAQIRANGPDSQRARHSVMQPVHA
jgi:hypothetical protein